MGVGVGGGVGCLPQCMLGYTPPRQTPLPDGHCSGRYASYWNAFLVNINLSLQPMDLYLWIFIRDKGYFALEILRLHP